MSAPGLLFRHVGFGRLLLPQPHPLQLTVIKWTHSATAGSHIGTGRPSLRSLIKTPEGLTMNPILFLSLVIFLSAALPWWPYSAYGRLRHHRPWDWLLDTPSSEDKLSFWQHYDQRREALRRGLTP